MTLKKVLVQLGVLAGALIYSGILIAQCCSVSTDKDFEIPQTSKRPEIDGHFSMQEWEAAIKIEDIHQIRPIEFSQPSQKTTFYLMYDEDAIYVAAYAYDTEPEKIVASTLRQGAFIFNDDRISIILDPYNNNRSGYDFRLNPNGVRLDSIYTDGTDAVHDWEGIWTGAAEIVEDGWVAEFAIPFKTMGFDPSNETWGITFWRDIPRNGEMMGWTSFNGQVNPTTAGEMNGLKGLSQGLGLDVIPSFSVTHNEDRRANRSESDYQPSLDLTYKLTPALNLTATWNTDFAATEVDDRQLDLDRFNVFFPEKRTFFLTDFDIFQFGGIGGENLVGVSSDQNAMPFFSRRIGISPSGEPVDIVGGLKLSGRLGSFDVGTLVMRQEDYLYNNSTQSVDAGNIYIARVVHPILEESQVGFIYTDGDPGSNLDSSTLGVDFVYRNTQLPNNRSLVSNIWFQQTDNDFLTGDDQAWSVSVSLPSKNSWYAGGQVHEVQENYDPAVGYTSRTGVRLYSAKMGYTSIFQDYWMQSLDANITADRWNHLDNGDLQSQRLSLTPFNLRNSAGDNLRMTVAARTENLRPGDRKPLRSYVFIADGEYDFVNYDFVARSSSSRPLSIELRTNTGTYYDGNTWGISPEIAWKPNKSLSFSLDYSMDFYSFGSTDFIIREMEFVNEIVFTPDLSMINLIQWDSDSRDLLFNARFRWNIEPGQDIWFVLGHSMSDQDEDGHYIDEDTSLVGKVRYTFRF